MVAREGETHMPEVESRKPRVMTLRVSERDFTLCNHQVILGMISLKLTGYCPDWDTGALVKEINIFPRLKSNNTLTDLAKAL